MIEQGKTQVIPFEKLARRETLLAKLLPWLVVARDVLSLGLGG